MIKIVSLFCLIIYGLLSGHVVAEVVFLNDDTFEHQTQASTGATTGSWLIMMGTSNGCSACDSLKAVFEELGQDEELYENSIVLGHLDVNESPNTAMRFGVKSIPTLVYLHKKKLYRFPADVERTLESMKEFTIEHYSKSPAEDIPSPPTALDQLLDLWAKLQENTILFYAFLVMAMILLGTIFVLVMTLLGGGKSKIQSKKE